MRNRDFATPEEYVAYVRECFGVSQRPFAPSTVFELAALKTEVPEFFTCQSALKASQ